MPLHAKPLGNKVHAIDAALPRAGAMPGLRRDPLTWLARARRRHGDAFAIADGAPLLSRERNCAGTVAVFGAELHRAVLTDVDRYVLPISIAQVLDLPPPLANLGAGLRDALHDRRRLAAVRVPVGAVDAIVAARCARWRRRSAVRLVEAMHALTIDLAARVLFGDAAFSPTVLVDYAQMLRAAAAGERDDADARAALVRRGLAADAALRAWRREARGDGVLVPPAHDDALPDDAFAALAYGAFVACCEPVEIALTWLVVLLSQQAGLRAALRTAEPGDGTRHGLVARVVDETLRLLPPYALLARVTATPVVLAGRSLPAGCEVVVSPFLAQRDPQVFPEPRRFVPDRWLAPRPSPFDHFPFGAGGHACAGRALALALVDAALAALVRCADVVLAGDQAIDWRARRRLRPVHDPVVRFRASRRAGEGGAIYGGLLRLVDFAKP